MWMNKFRGRYTYSTHVAQCNRTLSRSTEYDTKADIKFSTRHVSEHVSKLATFKKETT